ncbi:MAG: hypothetical protein II820_02535 [Ruminiclostridium sp.]|nr:hypothetical protein [Ruminiclostridium sp.]
MFSELAGIAPETGLEFDGEDTLYGYIRGYGVTVTETGDHYRVKLFCEMPSGMSDTGVKELIGAVSELGEGLPKNAVRSLSREDGCVVILLDKYCLFQENAEYLIVFLDKLAGVPERFGIKGAGYMTERKFSAKAPEAPKPEKGEVLIKLGFDARSLLGVLGAIVGAAAMIVIAVLTVNADLEINTFELRFEISTYILSAITAAVVFADYRFLARKLDACGVIVCPVLTLASVVLSGLGAGVKACAEFAGVSFMEALRGFPQYLERYENVGSFMFGYISRGIILAVIACIAIYIFYFNRHPDETMRSERIASANENPFGKRPDDR